MEIGIEQKAKQNKLCVFAIPIQMHAYIIHVGAVWWRCMCVCVCARRVRYHHHFIN